MKIDSEANHYHRLTLVVPNANPLEGVIHLDGRLLRGVISANIDVGEGSLATITLRMYAALDVDLTLEPDQIRVHLELENG